MIAFIIEFKHPEKYLWEPIGIIGVKDPDPSKLMDLIREKLPELHDFEIRLVAFRRIPKVCIEGQLLGSIPIITDNGENHEGIEKHPGLSN